MTYTQLIIAFASAFFSVVTVHGATPERIQRLDAFEKSYKSAKKITDLLKQAEATLSFHDYRFLRESIESSKLQNEKLPILRRKGPAEFEYEMRGSIVNVRWDDEDRLMVNRQRLEFEGEITAAELLKRVQNALPRKTSALPSLLLPRAEAALDMISTALGLITTLSELFQKNASCPNLNEKTQDCLYALRQFDPEIRLPPARGQRRTAGEGFELRSGGKIRCPVDLNDTTYAIGMSQDEYEGLERNIGAQVTCKAKLEGLKNCSSAMKCSLLACGWSSATIQRNSTVGEVSVGSCRSLLEKTRQLANPGRVTQPLNHNGAPLDVRPAPQQDSRR